ncbi:MAG: POTRA domain-containing protein [Bacteroidales bacterium]|nr:POTRA domain-containing protein [Bacteroidales bacterium]
MPLLIKYRQLSFLIPVITWLAFAALNPPITAGMNANNTEVIIHKIIFKGNKITKDHIIRRELMFAIDDTLLEQNLDALVEQSRENLLNTSLFNFVEAEVVSVDGQQQKVNVVFIFTERWYIWPWPIIEFADRNFNTWWQDNRNLSRMSYGVVLKWNNFRGRKESVDFTARFGYNELYGLDYTLPYLDKNETFGIGMGVFYGRTREVPVININDKLQYFKDDDYLMESVNAYIGLIYRKQIYNTHTLLLGYDLKTFEDTLIRINPSFSLEERTKLQYFTLSYQFKSDHRDYRPYPLEGYYFDLELAAKGFGLLENGGLENFYVLTTFRKFMKLNKGFYFAAGINSKFSNNAKQPYFMIEAIGFGRDIVRGYEYYVVNGNNFGIFKSNLKFALLPKREFDIDFIRSDKFGRIHYAFYINAFFDLGFADHFYPGPGLNNKLENTLLLGYGLGLDFVTYYDLVFRFEYAINKMNKQGFYLHFTAPI